MVHAFVEPTAPISMRIGQITAKILDEGFRDLTKRPTVEGDRQTQYIPPLKGIGGRKRAEAHGAFGFWWYPDDSRRHLRTPSRRQPQLHLRLAHTPGVVENASFQINVGA